MQDGGMCWEMYAEFWLENLKGKEHPEDGRILK
jgi:hypothetical protein